MRSELQAFLALGLLDPTIELDSNEVKAVEIMNNFVTQPVNDLLSIHKIRYKFTLGTDSSPKMDIVPSKENWGPPPIRYQRAYV